MFFSVVYIFFGNNICFFDILFSLFALNVIGKNVGFNNLVRSNCCFSDCWKKSCWIVSLRGLEFNKFVLFVVYKNFLLCFVIVVFLLR